MTITTHDEARLLATIQQRCTALRQQLCDDLHALVTAGALNEEWKAVADQQRETIGRLEAEKAALSAHLETVATERDGLRSRVMELERKLAVWIGIHNAPRTLQEPFSGTTLQERDE